jgi:hypothetical protein
MLMSHYVSASFACSQRGGDVARLGAEHRLDRVGVAAWSHRNKNIRMGRVKPAAAHAELHMKPSNECIDCYHGKLRNNLKRKSRKEKKRERRPSGYVYTPESSGRPESSHPCMDAGCRKPRGRVKTLQSAPQSVRRQATIHNQRSTQVQTKTKRKRKRKRKSKQRALAESQQNPPPPSCASRSDRAAAPVP